MSGRWTLGHPGILKAAFIASLSMGPAPLRAQNQDDGLDLFERMQEKLNAAATVQTKVIATEEYSGPRQPKVTRTLEALLHLQKGEKSRLTLVETTTLGGRPFKSRSGIISNGKDLAFHVTSVFTPERISWEKQDIPPDWNASILQGLTCLGLKSGFQFSAPYKAGSKVTEYSVATQRKLVPCGFTLTRTEKLGAKEARVIDYSVETTDGETTAAHRCTLWLDSATLMPLKRENRYTLGRGRDACDTRVVEAFEYFKVDERIDPRQFQFPTDE
ncbi:MAG: hypothetical protein HY293_07140 [Planctomycetes bacterium]|nr:hypothetical protein [Planctomycetota bacterium]